jgi:hypothetical protein
MPIKVLSKQRFGGRNFNFSETTSVPIITANLVMNLDAGNSSSYPGSGNTWTDLSGNGNNGTLVNGPTYSSANGGSIVFDGSNDYVSGTISNLSEYTLSAMVKILATVAGGGIIGGNITTNAYLQLGGGTFPWQFNSAFNSSYTPVLSQWTYVVGVQESGSTQRLYINGTSVSSASGTSNLGTAYAIGRRENGPVYLNCQIGVSQIYNRALSATEILQNFYSLKDRYGI